MLGVNIACDLCRFLLSMWLKEVNRTTTAEEQKRSRRGGRSTHALRASAVSSPVLPALTCPCTVAQAFKNGVHDSRTQRREQRLVGRRDDAAEIGSGW